MTNSSPLKIRPAADLLDCEDAAPPFVLDPIIAPGTAALIYGPAGVGKSFLALGLALAAAGGGSFLGWTAPRPHRVVYLDGEMRPEAVAERLRLFGPPPPSLRMWLAAEHEGRRFDLATIDGIHRLAQGWGDPDLVIVDSLTSLAGITRNDPDRWREMRYFLGLMRNSGRAIVLVHHANRDGAMRGMSQRADAMDLIMALRRPRDWRPSDGARFELRMEKARHQGGRALAPIEAQLRTGPDGTGQWLWHQGGNLALLKAVPLLQQGMKPEAVAKAIGVSPRTGYRLQAKARVLGLVA